jgi:hypothetical protein
VTEKKRIIRIMFAKIKPAYFELSEEEQQEFMRKDRERMEELGYKLHFMLDCSWSNKEWQFIGIEEWPSMEAIEKIEKFHEEELEASKYAEYKTYLCTPVYDEYTQSGITNK